MSGMEPEVRQYLQGIAVSISLILLWMLTLILFGLRLGYFFFEDGHILGSILCYAWMIVSGFFLVRWLLKRWKPHF